MIVELTKEYEKKWNEYLNKNPNSTIFHTLKWKELIKKNHNYNPLYFLSLENNQVNGILPLFHIKNLFSNKISSNPFSFLAPILYDNEEILKSLIKYAIDLTRRKNVDFLELKFIGELKKEIANEINLIEVKDKYIFPILYLSDNIEEIKNNYKGGLKRNVRRYNIKAKKDNIKFEFVDDEDSFEQFYYLLLKETIKKHKSICQTYNFYKELYKNNKLFVARKNKKILAGIFLLIYNKEVKYFLGTTDLKYKKIRLLTLLVDKAIEWSIKNNFKIFDHGLTSPYQKGLLEFKTNWGSRIHNIDYYYFLINKKEIPKLDITTSYKTIREIYKYFPNFLVKPILPFLTKQFG